MVDFLFASNSISHFAGSEPSADAWSFDSARVPYSIYTPASTVCAAPKHTASSGDETWYHFRHGSDVWDANVNENIVRIDDEDSNTLFSMYYRSQTGGYNMTFSVDGESENVTKSLPILASQMRTCDVKIRLVGFVAECLVYINKILIGTMTLAITTFKKPQFLLLGGNVDAGWFSEILVAESDTRNARMDLIRPIASGAHTDWEGSLTALSDDDPTTGMTTTTANQEQTTLMEDYTGADNISNIIQVTSTVRGVNSPTKLQHLIRMSAVDYASSNIDLDFSEEYQVTDWVENPATTAPWSKSDLSSIEFGFKSIA